MTNHKQLFLVYDQQCPACNYYSQLVRVGETVGELVLINARENHEIMAEITALGLDIDQGIVLKVEDEIYYGPAAMHALALLSTRSGLFNRTSYWLFKYNFIARWLYPVLRFFRNLLLKLLGKSKINNLNTHDNNKF